MMFQVLLYTGVLTYCKAYISNEVVSEYDLASVIQNGLSRFTVNLNKFMIEKNAGKGNIVFSPINSYEIITIISTGVGGTVRDELCDALGTPTNVDSLEAHLIVKTMLYLIHQYSSNEKPSTNGLSWKEGLQLKDWRSFFSEKLNDPNLPGKDIVTELMDKWLPGTTYDPSVLRLKMAPVLKLMVAKPVYFHEAWKGISKNVLLSGTFKTGEKIIETKVIDHKQEFPYLNNPTMRYEAIAIPYENPHFFMYVVLPYENHTLTSLMNNFNTSDYSNLIENLHTNTPIHLRIPKLQFKWASNITQTLTDFGIGEIFSGIIIDKIVSSMQLTVSFETIGAQLSMTDYFRPRPRPRYAYDDIPRQKLLPENRLFGDHVNVTEMGLSFYVNRPFMFFIYNHENKVILFSGLVYDPSIITNT